jgi:hypothetical protein
MSEGTSVSPPFPTTEELVSYLARAFVMWGFTPTPSVVDGRIVES